MRRALSALLVTAAAFASLAPGAGAAGPRYGLVFYLHDAGFAIEGRSALGSGGIRLVLDRHGEAAYYFVKASVGRGTVQARFGRLGSVAMRFVPGRGEGATGCGGSEGWQEGLFVGSIVFRGEHDYAHVDARRAQGYFQTRPSKECGRRRASASAATAARAPGRTAPIAETGARLEGSTGSRLPERWFSFFTYNGPGGVRNVLEAFQVERRAGVRIERGGEVYGGAASFEWNLAARTARVEPPAPFRGRAFYREGAAGRPARWTGSLSVPILGGRPMRVAAPALDARLLAGTPFL